MYLVMLRTLLMMHWLHIAFYDVNPVLTMLLSRFFTVGYATPICIRFAMTGAEAIIRWCPAMKLSVAFSSSGRM